MKYGNEGWLWHVIGWLFAHDIRWLAHILADRYYPICLPCRLTEPCPAHDTDAFLAQETDLITEDSHWYDECMACIEPERYDDHIHKGN